VVKDVPFRVDVFWTLRVLLLLRVVWVVLVEAVHAQRRSGGTGAHLREAPRTVVGPVPVQRERLLDAEVVECIKAPLAQRDAGHSRGEERVCE
jgi:hypothetical protein